MDASTAPFALELADPLETAGGTIERREGVVVRVAGETVGLGESTPLPGWTEPLETCRDALEAATGRLESAGPEAALTALESTPAARHGLALALADLRARRAGVPLYRHLGADASVEDVPVNATVGDAPPGETARSAREAVSDGYGCVKVKVGSRSIESDRRRLERVREAVGPDVELRADANGAWTLAEARRAFDRLEDVGVSYVEQPLPAADLEGHAQLRGGAVGVAIDEGLAERGVDAVLEAGAADVLVLKPMAVGGVDRAVSIARRARDRGLEVVITTTIDGSVARAGAVHLAASLAPLPACGLATAGLLAEDLGPEPAPVADGSIAVPQGNGLGASVAWNE